MYCDHVVSELGQVNNGSGHAVVELDQGQVNNNKCHAVLDLVHGQVNNNIDQVVLDQELGHLNNNRVQVAQGKHVNACVCSTDVILPVSEFLLNENVVQSLCKQGAAVEGDVVVKNDCIIPGVGHTHDLTQLSCVQAKIEVDSLVGKRNVFPHEASTNQHDVISKTQTGVKHVFGLDSMIHENVISPRQVLIAPPSVASMTLNIENWRHYLPAMTRKK
jgi:hypothetical protein